MRKFLCLLLALVIFTMAGCGVEPPAETTAPVEILMMEVPYETEADLRPYVDVELVFWAAMEETDPEAQVLLQAARVFEKQTGGVVTIRWEDGREALAEGAADIVRLPLEALAEQQEKLLDLTEMAARADYENRSFPVLRQQVIERCGNLKAIPQVPELVGLYYQQEAFVNFAPPADWMDFLALCADLVVDGWFPLALNEEDAPLALALHLGDDSAMEAEELAERGQQILNLVEAGYVKLTAAPGAQNKLAISNVAMALGSSSHCAAVEEATLTDVRWGVFPWPGGGSSVSSEVLSISGACSNAQAAFDFIMLLTTGEFDQLRADVTCGIPADPGNQSVIEGAVDAMHAATAKIPAAYSEARAKVAQKLWADKYKSGKAFASVWAVTE